MALSGSSSSRWDSPEIISYRHAHQESIESVLGNAVNLVFNERPPNPIQFIVRHVVEHSGAYAGPPDIQAEIERLRARNESLTTENERLKTALAQASAARPEAKADEPPSKPAAGQLTRQTSAVAQLAETAGIIAVGSRVYKGTYEQPMKEWAEKADAPLPKQVLLNTSTAVVQALATRYLAVLKERKQVEELKASLKTLVNANITRRTRVESLLAEAEKREKMAAEGLTAAEARVDTVMLAAAEAISPSLARDGAKYSATVVEMIEKEPGVLEELNEEVATVVNRGAVEVGEIVEVVVNGTMQRAQVRSADAKDEYELSLWTEVNYSSLKYEEGFHTSQPKLITVPRRDVYANRKHKQTLSPEALALAKSRAEAEAKARGTTALKETAPKPESPEYLSLLYLDAERALPSLHDLGGDITRVLPDVEPIVAPLKGEARACVKTIDKYVGDYRRLTDLARMTLKCPTLRAALEALRFLAKHGGFMIVLIKNRLMLAFDAGASGGYRDLLLNLKSQSGHTVELQITLTPLLAIKAGGGHTAYQIARVHGFFEKDVNRHEGALSAGVLEKLRCGMLRELVCMGTSVGLTAHFDELLAALGAPSCQLRELKIGECDWPEGRTLAELVDALPARGLKLFSVGSMKAGGALPAALFEKCVEAEFVGLGGMALTGSIPASVGKCIKLKTLWLHDNQLEGDVPASELAKLTALEELALVQNEALTITVSGRQEIKRAAPKAKIFWPRVVNA